MSNKKPMKYLDHILLRDQSFNVPVLHSLMVSECPGLPWPISQHLRTQEVVTRDQRWQEGNRKGIYEIDYDHSCKKLKVLKKSNISFYRNFAANLQMWQEKEKAFHCLNTYMTGSGINIKNMATDQLKKQVQFLKTYNYISSRDLAYIWLPSQTFQFLKSFSGVRTLFTFKTSITFKFHITLEINLWVLQAHIK